MGASLLFPDGVVSLQNGHPNPGFNVGFTTLAFDVVTDESWDKTNEITEHPVESGSDITDNVRVGLSTCQLSVFVTNEPFEANSFTTPTLTQTVINVPSPKARGKVTEVQAVEWNNELNFKAALSGTGSIVGATIGGSAGSVVGTAIGGIASALLSPPGPRAVTVQPMGGLGVNTSQAGGQRNMQLMQQSTPGDYVSLMDAALETLQNNATLITVVGSKKSKQNMEIVSVNQHRSADTGTGAEFTISLKEVRFVSTQTVPAPAATVVRATAPQNKGPQNPTPAPAPINRSVLRGMVIQSIKTGGGMMTTDQVSASGLTSGDLAAISAATGG